QQRVLPVALQIVAVPEVPGVAEDRHEDREVGRRLVPQLDDPPPAGGEVLHVQRDEDDEQEQRAPGHQPRSRRSDGMASTATTPPTRPSSTRTAVSQSAVPKVVTTPRRAAPANPARMAMLSPFVRSVFRRDSRSRP